MSLSGTSNETERATAQFNLPTGGASVDQERIQATEDREIVAIKSYKRIEDGVIEVSFSSSPSVGTASNQVDSTKASAVHVQGGSTEDLTHGLSINWDAGEELHIHTFNNSGGSTEGAIIVYYREL